MTTASKSQQDQGHWFIPTDCTGQEDAGGPWVVRQSPLATNNKLQKKNGKGKRCEAAVGLMNGVQMMFYLENQGIRKTSEDGKKNRSSSSIQFPYFTDSFWAVRDAIAQKKEAENVHLIMNPWGGTMPHNQVGILQSRSGALLKV